MQSLKSLWHRLSRTFSIIVLNYGARPFMIFVLATLALFNAFVPMTPNAFILILAILQPEREKLIVVLFAISAGLSAFAFALILSRFNDSAQLLGVETFGEHWETAQQIMATYGPGLLVLLSIFPDIPRPSITVVSFSGVAPIWIGLMVFIGKLVLYSLLIKLLNSVPLFLARRREASWKITAWIYAKAKRFEAYKRRLKYIVKQNEREGI